MKKLILRISEYKLVFISVAFLVIFSFGCGKKDEKEIRIGAILPLTGEVALYGENCKKGMDLALDEININEGIYDKRIKIIYEDSKGLPAEGVAACKKLIFVHKVPAIIGDVASSVTLAIAPIVNENKVVLLTPLSSAPAITNAGDYVFRNVPSDLYGGKVAAHFVVEHQKWKSVAILYINNDFGVGLRKIFTEDVKRLGGKIVAAEAYEQGSTDFRTQLTKIKSSVPEALYLVGYREVSQILIQAKEIGLKVQFIGTGLLEDPKILEVAKDAAENVYFTQLQYDPESPDPVVQKFISSFEKKFVAKPDIFAAYGYDALRVLNFAMVDSHFTADSIKEQLYSVRKFSGVTGKIEFDQNGDVIQPMGVKIIKNDKFSWFKRVISILNE